jgi:hypothetical protein
MQTVSIPRKTVRAEVISAIKTVSFPIEGSIVADRNRLDGAIPLLKITTARLIYSGPVEIFPRFEICRKNATERAIPEDLFACL